MTLHRVLSQAKATLSDERVRWSGLEAQVAELQNERITKQAEHERKVGSWQPRAFGA
jgi:hypothetical protein